jgi:hypothetical protein
MVSELLIDDLHIAADYLSTRNWRIGFPSCRPMLGPEVAFACCAYSTQGETPPIELEIEHLSI